jgi:hypothetical protein
MSQRLLVKSARHVGGVDAIFAHSPRNIDRAFRRRNAAILDQPRGAGYWLWKPYFIHRHLRDLGANDWLFYCDAGAIVVERPNLLVAHALAEQLDVMVFDGQPSWLEFLWTKRDAFLLAGCDAPRFWGSTQIIGGLSLWRGTGAARELAQEWLDLSSDPRAITDLANQLGQPNLPGFREHRHDQSLLSLLAKRRGVRSWRDPSQHGSRWHSRYPDSRYPQIVHLTRWELPTPRQRAVRYVRRSLGRRSRSLRTVLHRGETRC